MGAFALGAVFYPGRGGVHAASALDDNSVSALTALDQAMESVASRVTPAVVNIAVTAQVTPDQDAEGEQGQMQGLPPGLQQFFGPGLGQGPQGPQIEHGIGSGVIISPDGYIVTNNHVVDGAKQVRVTLHDRRILAAKVVGVDKLTDLAVVKVDAHDLPTISWGDSRKLSPGQTVLAFGSPFGYLQFSVTRGIVSAVDRPNPFRDDARKPGGFIQTDAAINPGNSGGPLVNAHGELVGINSSIVSSNGSFAGAGFAIPSQIVRYTTDQIIKNGKVEHGFLGISMNDVTPANASFFNLKDASGALISQVSPDSPASQAGLHNGDVITKLNGQTIENSSALQVAVSEMAPGTKILLGIMRDGKPQNVDMTVGKFHSNTEVADNEDNPDAQKGKLGLAVADLTPEARRQLQVPERLQGVVIENVRPASPADDAGLQPGDVILEVDRKPATSASQFVNAVHQSASDKDVLLLVWSHGGTSYLTLRPDVAGQNGE